MQKLLAQALQRRSVVGLNIEAPFEGALRLFNGFTEVQPGVGAESAVLGKLAVDLYAHTLVIHDYAQSTGQQTASLLLSTLLAYYQQALPAGIVRCALLKTHARGASQSQVLFGGPPAVQVFENGIWYALDLLFQQDASLYLDTRSLRRWLKANLAGKSLLNTFAYTGSLGAAALAGGACRVVQTDRNPRFLSLAHKTYTLNSLASPESDFITGDFFNVISRLKARQQLFDCVILDPPFFSASAQGRVDLGASERLINKLRPLVADDGWLVVVNNALFISGASFQASLHSLCGPYLQIDSFLDVDADFASGSTSALPADPAPFNHSTKIAILKTRRKDGKK